MHIDLAKRQPPPQLPKRNESRERGNKQRKGLRGRISTYAPLVTNPAHIYQKVLTMEFCGIPKPPPLKHKSQKGRYEYYHFHESYEHLTDECVQLRDAIEQLIRRGRLSQYIEHVKGNG